jgi:hypothetical protein
MNWNDVFETLEEKEKVDSFDDNQELSVSVTELLRDEIYRLIPERKEVLRELFEGYLPAFKILPDTVSSEMFLLDSCAFNSKHDVRFTLRRIYATLLSVDLAWKLFCAVNSNAPNRELADILLKIHGLYHEKNEEVDDLDSPEHFSCKPDKKTVANVIKKFEIKSVESTQDQLVNDLTTIAILWALFHEAGHLIVKQSGMLELTNRINQLSGEQNNHQDIFSKNVENNIEIEEFNCDTFATFILTSSSHDCCKKTIDKLKTGVLLAFFAEIIFEWVKEIDWHEKTDEHPIILDRIENILACMSIKNIEQSELEGTPMLIAFGAFIGLNILINSPCPDPLR